MDLHDRDGNSLEVHSLHCEAREGKDISIGLHVREPTQEFVGDRERNGCAGVAYSNKNIPWGPMPGQIISEGADCLSDSVRVGEGLLALDPVGFRVLHELFEFFNARQCVWYAPCQLPPL